MKVTPTEPGQQESRVHIYRTGDPPQAQDGRADLRRRGPGLTKTGPRPRRKAAAGSPQSARCAGKGEACLLGFLRVSCPGKRGRSSLGGGEGTCRRGGGGGSGPVSGRRSRRAERSPLFCPRLRLLLPLELSAHPGATLWGTVSRTPPVVCPGNSLLPRAQDTPPIFGLFSFFLLEGLER